MTELIILSLVVFAITLTVTKARIFASTREFVKYRYEAAFVNGQRPRWFHRWWNAMWRCSMCLGLWISLLICWFCPTEAIYKILWFCPPKAVYWMTVLVVYGLNWLWHCLESVLFFMGKYFEKKSVEGGKVENGEV